MIPDCLGETIERLHCLEAMIELERELVAELARLSDARNGNNPEGSQIDDFLGLAAERGRRQISLQGIRPPASQSKDDLAWGGMAAAA
jgi:hypothetical protein